MSVICCFGEVLWDIFPTYDRIGGAPLNVALRLASLGDQSWMVSKVGQDKLGEQIMEHFDNLQLSTQLIQKDSELPTGSVEVELDESGTASYTIKKPVAWDKIAWNENTARIVSESDVLVYGSLASRSLISSNTLKRLLQAANKKVFDVNLRPPHFNMEILQDLLWAADLVKMNQEELELILSFMAIQSTSNKKAMKNLQSSLPNRPDLCLTRGSKGALMLYEGEFYENPGHKVKVVDTVGAGDSFLAMLLHHLLKKIPPQKALDLACAMGSAVASKSGATCKVSQQELSRMLRRAY